jgi:copper chaperone CopZ
MYIFIIEIIINIANYSHITNREVCMRAWTIILAVILFTAFGIAQDKPTSKELTLKVSGMMCGACESKVEKAAAGIEGVGSAKASHEQGEVKIILTGDVSTAQIENAINETGFSVVKEEQKKREKKKDKKKDTDTGFTVIND